MRADLVRTLMSARQAVRDTDGDPEQIASARVAVGAARQALGERGPAWWDDNAPDFNRRMVANTPYAALYVDLGN